MDLIDKICQDVMMRPRKAREGKGREVRRMREGDMIPVSIIIVIKLEAQCHPISCHVMPYHAMSGKPMYTLSYTLPKIPPQSKSLQHYYEQYPPSYVLCRSIFLFHWRE